MTLKTATQRLKTIYDIKANTGIQQGRLLLNQNGMELEEGVHS